MTGVPEARRMLTRPSLPEPRRCRLKPASDEARIGRGSRKSSRSPECVQGESTCICSQIGSPGGPDVTPSALWGLWVALGRAGRRIRRLRRFLSNFASRIAGRIHDAPPTRKHWTQPGTPKSWSLEPGDPVDPVSVSPAPGCPADLALDLALALLLKLRNK